MKSDLKYRIKHITQDSSLQQVIYFCILKPTSIRFTLSDDDLFPGVLYYLFNLNTNVSWS